MNRGIWYGFGAYLIWGFFPVYFKALQQVSAAQILAHRIVWSVVFLAAILALRREWPGLQAAVRGPRVLATYGLAALLLAVNWLVYIWGVNSGRVVETSLGYFINPLVSVALGVLFLGERLRPLQWLPIGLAAAGVLYLTVQVGSPPWIALALAFSFGVYGLLKKVAPLGALHGLSLETGILFLPALGYLLWLAGQGSGSFGPASGPVNLLLALAGIITAVPLLLFASAARSIPLWTVGLLQYIAPTCQFLLGVLVYREPFTPARLVGFVIIWSALALFTLESFAARRRQAAL